MIVLFLQRPNLSHGEDLFVVMFGGLHSEMGIWKILGHYLASSGWTIPLTDAGIATVDAADSFLKTSHLTRTRRAHQLTCSIAYPSTKSIRTC